MGLYSIRYTYRYLRWDNDSREGKRPRCVWLVIAPALLQYLVVTFL
jgi:hypothetical protein